MGFIEILPPRVEAAPPRVGETTAGRATGAGEKGAGQCHASCRSKNEQNCIDHINVKTVHTVNSSYQGLHFSYGIFLYGSNGKKGDLS